jgi:hypothetical protein
LRVTGRLAALFALMIAWQACSSFGSSESGGDAGEVDTGHAGSASDADAASPETDGGSDAAVGCPAISFCDDFERTDVRGEWDYPESTARGDSKLVTDSTTAASKSRSLLASTGTGTSARVNALSHTFLSAPILPFKITFALRLDAMPSANVRVVRVLFDSASSVWVQLGPTGLQLGMQAVYQGMDFASGSNPAELGATGTWGRYTLRIEAGQATLALENGTKSATVVPFSVDFGHSQQVSFGMPLIDPSSSSAAFGLDDVVIPK